MKYRYVLALIVFFATGMLQTSHAQALYLQVAGIDGESNHVTHQDWIDVTAFSHSMANSFMIGNTPGSPVHSPLSITKYLDKSSVKLIEKLNNGAAIQDATLEYVVQAGSAQVVSFRIELDGVYVTSSVLSASFGSLVSENVTLLYNKIKFTYWPIDNNGTQGTPIITTWDVLNDQPLPASMVGLSVQTDGDDVIFGWQTLNESGNFGFEVQHQEDGEFRRAAYVPATGWSEQPLEYQVRVRGLEQGIHVFRVASLALGGGVSYSQEMTVALGVPNGLTLALDAPYPNPFSDRTNLAVSVARDDDARVSVWDMLGREVAVLHEGPLLSGTKSRFVFEPADHSLSAGTYMVRVKTERDVATRMISVVR